MIPCCGGWRRRARINRSGCLRCSAWRCWSTWPTRCSDPRGKQAEIGRSEAARILAPKFRDVPEDQRAAAAERFLEDEETDSGILVSRGETLRYWHLTFQEYLTAKALVWK